MKASEIIREARNVLFERGWTQGELIAESGELCLEGALSLAETGEIRYLPYCGAVDAVMKALDVKWRDSLWGFNDTTGRTFDEVIDALDRAEKIAEAEEVDE
jgi:hypothetical protein